MFELKEYYTLEEALKLYALYQMETDIREAKMAEMEHDKGRKR